jgi:hypothetical protein
LINTVLLAPGAHSARNYHALNAAGELSHAELPQKVSREEDDRFNIGSCSHEHCYDHLDLTFSRSRIAVTYYRSTSPGEISHLESIQSRPSTCLNHAAACSVVGGAREASTKEQTIQWLFL